MILPRLWAALWRLWRFRDCGAAKQVPRHYQVVLYNSIGLLGLTHPAQMNSQYCVHFSKIGGELKRKNRVASGNLAAGLDLGVSRLKNCEICSRKSRI